MRFLDKFMESLAANPTIKNSKVFYDFLSIENESDFNNKKKEYAKLKPPSKLSEIKTIEGEVKIMLKNTILKNYILLLIFIR
jgi:hypothetical protein